MAEKGEIIYKESNENLEKRKKDTKIGFILSIGTLIAVICIMIYFSLISIINKSLLLSLAISTIVLCIIAIYGYYTGLKFIRRFIIYQNGYVGITKKFINFKDVNKLKIYNYKTNEYAMHIYYRKYGYSVFVTWFKIEKEKIKNIFSEKRIFVKEELPG